MRHAIALAVLVALASLASLAVVAAAQPLPSDTLGLWFDADYEQNVLDPPLFVPVEGYLVLHEPSVDQIAGFELMFGWPTEIVLLSASWWSGPIVSIVDGCTVVEYWTPLPPQPATLLATFTFLTVVPPQNALVIVEACAGRPCPQVSDGEGFVCLGTALAEGAVACLGQCSVPSAATRWSAIKDLYR
jgi:hypothetical protein